MTDDEYLESLGGAGCADLDWSEILEDEVLRLRAKLEYAVSEIATELNDTNRAIGYRDGLEFALRALGKTGAA